MNFIQEIFRLLDKRMANEMRTKWRRRMGIHPATLHSIDQRAAVFVDCFASGYIRQNYRRMAYGIWRCNQLSQPTKCHSTVDDVMLTTDYGAWDGCQIRYAQMIFNLMPAEKLQNDFLILITNTSNFALLPNCVVLQTYLSLLFFYRIHRFCRLQRFNYIWIDWYLFSVYICS